MPTVIKALELITNQLRRNPPKERPHFSTVGNPKIPQLPLQSPQFSHSSMFPNSSQYPHPPASSSAPPPSLYPSPYAPISPPMSVGGGTGGGVVEVSFRVLCPLGKIGHIIGKGGGMIQQIRESTGAKIKIEEQVEGCEERVVLLSALEVRLGV